MEYTAPPISYRYTPADIFTVLSVGVGFYDYANESYLVSSDTLNEFALQIQSNSLMGIGSGDEYNTARNIITIPLVSVNLADFPDFKSFLPGDFAVNGYLAKPHYRVLISNY